MTLTEFLLARIAEDEDIARGATSRWRNEWSSEDAAVTEHIDRHDPARVLAECEAKRQIVERSDRPVAHAGQDIERRAVLALLALPYADHPDCDESWRP